MVSGKISCVMVTRPARVGLAQRAIINFLDQGYPDKELVVVGWSAQKLDEVILPIKHLDPDNRVTVIDVDFSRPLWSLFNVAVEQTTGEWITAWDDDNLSHPGRLHRQMQEAERQRPILFGSRLYPFMDSDELFVRDPGRAVFDGDARSKPHAFLTRVNPYTMLVHRDQFCGIPEVKGHPWINTTLAFYTMGLTPILIPGEPGWHKVGVLGGNVMGYDHHRNMVTGRGSVSSRGLIDQRHYLDEMLDAYRWDGPVTVCGSDHIAYEYRPEKFWLPSLTPVEPPMDGVTRISEEI